MGQGLITRRSSNGIKAFKEIPTLNGYTVAAAVSVELNLSNNGFFLGCASINASYSCRGQVLIDGDYIIGESGKCSNIYGGVVCPTAFKTSLSVRSASTASSLAPITSYKIGGNYDSATTYIDNPEPLSSGATNIIVNSTGAGRLASVSSYDGVIVRIVVDSVDKFYGYLSGCLYLDMKYNTSLAIYSSEAITSSVAPTCLVRED